MEIADVISAHIKSDAGSEGKKTEVRTCIEVLTSRILYVGSIPLIVQRQIIEQVTCSCLALAGVKHEIVSYEAVQLEMILKVLLHRSRLLLCLLRSKRRKHYQKG